MFQEIEARLDVVGVKIDVINVVIDHRFAAAEQSAALRHLELMARLDDLQRLVDHR